MCLFSNDIMGGMFETSAWRSKSLSRQGCDSQRFQSLGFLVSGFGQFLEHGATHVCSSGMLGEHIGHSHFGNASGGGWCSGWNIQKRHYHGATARWCRANGVPCWNMLKHAETADIMCSDFRMRFKTWTTDAIGNLINLINLIIIWSFSIEQRLNNGTRLLDPFRSFSILALTLLDIAQAWCGGRFGQQRPPQTRDEWSKLAGGAKQFYLCCYWRDLKIMSDDIWWSWFGVVWHCIVDGWSVVELFVIVVFFSLFQKLWTFLLEFFFSNLFLWSFFCDSVESCASQETLNRWRGWQQFQRERSFDSRGETQFVMNPIESVVMPCLICLICLIHRFVIDVSDVIGASEYVRTRKYYVTNCHHISPIGGSLDAMPWHALNLPLMALQVARGSGPEHHPNSGNPGGSWCLGAVKTRPDMPDSPGTEVDATLHTAQTSAAIPWATSTVGTWSALADSRGEASSFLHVFTVLFCSHLITDCITYHNMTLMTFDLDDLDELGASSTTRTSPKRCEELAAMNSMTDPGPGSKAGAGWR